MIRTATNVAGQALVPVIVSAREKILDHDKYNSASASPIDAFGSSDDAGRDGDRDRTPGPKDAVPVTA
ncbi:dicarboxylate/amino acid:cation symporter, partial [Streptomyces sp. SID8455]|nr:dicarboxylate/amino acid:cation symporter [Streptomyces sp. SID8455]